MPNFRTLILDRDSHSSTLCDLFISSEASICSTMALPPLGNSDHVVVSVSRLSIKLKFDVYFPHRKYQVKPNSFPWFLALCAATIAHINHFFRLYQQNKSSEFKATFGQANNRYKRVLEPPKLAYANKTKEFITSQKFGSRHFW